MLLLSVRYSETAINVNIFMRGGLSYFHSASRLFCALTGAVCWLTEIGQLKSRVVNVIIRPELFLLQVKMSVVKKPISEFGSLTVVYKRWKCPLVFSTT